MSRRVVPYDRTRRKRHWSLKDAPRKRKSRAWRFLNPLYYWRRLLLLLAALFLVLPYSADAVNLVFGAREAEGCRVVRVVDGDTVSLWCPNGLGTERARLVGFDTPEKFSPRCAAETGRALAAEWYLRRLLAMGDDLKVIRQGRDQYDRRLVKLWIDGEEVGRLMIDAGHARPYRGGIRGDWCG